MSDQPAKDTVNVISAEFWVTLPAVVFPTASPDGVIIDLLFSAIAFDGKGKAVAEVNRSLRGKMNSESSAQIRREGFHFQGVIDYPADTAKEIRFAIRNNITGDIGSVIVALNSP